MMKNLKYILFIALFLNTNIHPLTSADWRVIATLLASTSVIGGAAGAIAGTQLTYRGFVKKPGKTTMTTPEQLAVFSGGLGLGFATSWLGQEMGKRLAIAYIARKYGVKSNTAWLAIQKNLDLSTIAKQSTDK